MENRELFGKREPVDSYMRVLLATCTEGEGLKQHPSHPALLRGNATQFPRGRRCLPSAYTSILCVSLARIPAGVVGSLGIGAHA